ncbi:1481_t:CDS:1, partial [Racocetra persica]
CNPKYVYQCGSSTGEICEYGPRDSCKQCGALSCPTSINSTKITNSASNDSKQQMIALIIPCIIIFAIIALVLGYLIYQKRKDDVNNRNFAS